MFSMKEDRVQIKPISVIKRFHEPKHAISSEGANKLKLFLDQNYVAHHGWATKKFWVLEALKTADWRLKILGQDFLHSLGNDTKTRKKILSKS